MQLPKLGFIILSVLASNAAWSQIDPSVGGAVPQADFSKRYACLLYTSPSPRDLSTSRMPSSA